MTHWLVFIIVSVIWHDYDFNLPVVGDTILCCSSISFGNENNSKLGNGKKTI